MVEIICEKTGLKFEAENRRRKVHPVVQGWCTTAYEEGWYQEANNAIYGNRARNVEKQQFKTIEQFVTYFETLREQVLKQKEETEKARQKQERDAKEVRRQRSITNDLLRGRGYTWKKFQNDEEDQDMFGAPEYDWTLYSPDGRVVSVKEAMQELAFQNVSFAKEWLAERNIAEEIPTIEKKRKDEQTKSDAVAVKQSENEKYQQEVIAELLLNGFSPEDAQREAVRMSQPHSFQDRVRLSDSVQLDEDDEVAFVLDSDIRYGVTIGDDWRGIDYMLRLHNFLVDHHAQLLEASRRNEKRRERE